MDSILRGPLNIFFLRRYVMVKIFILRKVGGFGRWTLHWIRNLSNHSFVLTVIGSMYIYYFGPAACIHDEFVTLRACRVWAREGVPQALFFLGVKKGHAGRYARSDNAK